MKSEAIFLALPFVAMFLNVVFAAFFCLPHSDAQQPTLPQHHQGSGIQRSCISASGESEECPSSLGLASNETAAADDDDDHEEDPMLRPMPGYDNFKAYVRADVSAFYKEEPGSRKEYEPAFNGHACKFINMSPERVALYWEGNGKLVFNSFIDPWSAGGIACYPRNLFRFSKPDHQDEVLCRFRITSRTSVYFYDPYTPNDKIDPARANNMNNNILSLDTLSDNDRSLYDAHIFNLKFGAEYKKFTGGSEWLSMYPRNRPRHTIWRADYYGQEHVLSTNETHFVKIPQELVGRTLDINMMGKGHDPLTEYREPGMLNLTIKALSCAPRAFEIRNFLSDEEVDHILEVVKTKNLERSTTAGHKSDTRTSRTTWVGRKTDPIVNAVYRRAAAALRLDESLLRQRLVGELDDEQELLLKRRAIHEDMQIVHYNKMQEYTPHHDFGYPKAGQKDAPTRAINICMYLNDVPSGGETSFPRWRNGETSAALKVKPEKGKAMIFYMINPDGNLDDLSHHAGLPVLEGEKYFANLWIHDPIRGPVS